MPKSPQVQDERLGGLPARRLASARRGAPVSGRPDWEMFVSRFYPGSARHDHRMLNAYDEYRKGLPAERPNRPRDAEALRVWDNEGGAA